MATLKSQTDIIAALEKKKKQLQAAKEKGNKLAITKFTKQINELKKGIKTGKTVKDVSAKQLANSLLASRKKFLEMSKKDFNGVIRQLSKKPEYSFLKAYTRDEVIRDIQRKAKPVGWRFKGRGNYKTPTKKQVRERRGIDVYYENRPNRSDVSQARQLAKGGGVSDNFRYAIIVTNTQNPYENQSRVATVGRKGDAIIMLSALQNAAKNAPLDYKIVELYEDGGFVPMTMADLKAMRAAEYEPITDDNYEDDEDAIVRYYFEEEPQYAEQGGGIGGAAKRGAHKAKEAGDDIADWAFNFDPKKRYDNGGEVDINDLDIPVHYTMFEDEMYEYENGGNTDEKYLVKRVFKDGSRPRIVDENLTLEEARELVQEDIENNPKATYYMLVYTKMKKGGSVGEKYEVTFEDVFSFATMKKTGVLTDKQYKMALRQKKNKDVVIDKFNKSQGIREQYRIKDIKKIG